jgi:hypothetical protein
VDGESGIDGKRALLVAALASLSATAAIAIGVLLLGNFGETEWRVLGTTFGISLYSLLSLPGTILLERRQAAPLGWATIALAATSFVFALVALWIAEDSENAWRLTGTSTAFAVASTQIAALTTRRRDDDTSAVRGLYLTTVALVALLAVLATYALWKEPDAASFYRVLAALAVLDVFLVILQTLLRRLTGRSAATARVVLEGTREQIDDALSRVQGSGVRVRR